MEPTEHQSPSDEMTVEEIEQAYMRALEMAEVAESLFPDEAQLQDIERPIEIEEDPLPFVRVTSNEPDLSVLDDEGEESAAEEEPAEEIRIRPLQVLEALLFVGGQPLTGRHLAEILGGSHSHEDVDELLEQLNRLYLSEGRPYEVRLTEGGYRMVLRPEFDSVRSKVFGQGPKEVKLSQDVLEILAFVAYRQPVTREEVEQTEKKSVGAILRQLLRRELVALKREDNVETYHTTERFLDLFGLASLADLPRMADFTFK
ncbi:MAG: SMC-Scp complex subunit ScpB [Planctomycetaceae bacterium]|nr:SMC-Scp complex subunit ScpB [Planctomycetaceae bacterium]MCB9952014.1 SMC-Scp complex subunit ScpB [Planctomycetaceae bacterium]